MKFEYFTGFETVYRDAERFKRQGQFGEAFQRYQSIIFQRLSQAQEDSLLEQHFNDADMVLLTHLVELAVLFGYVDAADNLLVKIIEQSSVSYQIDYIHLFRIEMTLQRGLLREAYTRLEAMSSRIGDIHTIEFTNSGLEEWEKQCWQEESSTRRNILFLRLYQAMGWILANLGQYHDALIALERGKFYTEQQSSIRFQRFALQLQIARVHLENGNLQEARQRLEDFQPNLNHSQYPGVTVLYLELLGKLNFLQGKLGDALNQFWDILKICQEGHFYQAMLTAMVNLAHILILVNQTNIAERLLQAAQKQATQTNDQGTMARVAFLSQVADARAHSLVEGISIAPSVYEIRKRPKKKNVLPQNQTTEQESPLDIPQSDNYLTFFEDRALGFYWYLSRDLNTATNLLEQMQTVFKDTDSELIQLKLFMLRGILAYYQEHVKEAESLFDQLRPLLQKRELKPDLWQVQRFLIWCWIKLQKFEETNLPPKLSLLSRFFRPQRTAIHQSDEQRIYNLMEENKNLLDNIVKSLDISDQAIYRLNKWTVDEEYLAGEIDRLVKMEQKCRWWRPFARWSLWKRIYALMLHIDRYKHLLVEQSVKGEKIAAQSPQKAYSLSRFLLKHSSKHATISFLVLPDRVLITCVRRFSLKFGVSPLTRLQVRNYVQNWHELITGVQVGRDRDLSLDTDDEQPPEEPKQAQQEISNVLVERLQIHQLLKSLPKHIHALTIVPDDSLHGFPFAAILHEGQYLVERYALSIAFEATNQYAKPIVANVEGALLVGVSRGTTRIPELRGTQNELDLVHAWLTQHHLKIHRLDETVQDPATKAVILERLPNSNFFHIACHGKFQPDRPDQSGLVLIPALEKVEILSLRDLSRLNLFKTQHITLSNCWSADSFILPGRWIISLPETLWRAGAQSILGSLWQVNDQLASEFMKRFYEYLNTLPRDKALQRTQLDCIARKFSDIGVDSSSPNFWAGFNLYGSSQALNLRSYSKIC